MSHKSRFVTYKMLCVRFRRERYIKKGAHLSRGGPFFVLSTVFRVPVRLPILELERHAAGDSCDLYAPVYCFGAHTGKGSVLCQW